MREPFTCDKCGSLLYLPTGRRFPLDKPVGSMNPATIVARLLAIEAERRALFQAWRESALATAPVLKIRNPEVVRKITHHTTMENDLD